MKIRTRNYAVSIPCDDSADNEGTSEPDDVPVDRSGEPLQNPGQHRTDTSGNGASADSPRIYLREQKQPGAGGETVEEQPGSERNTEQRRAVCGWPTKPEDNVYKGHQCE